MHRKNSQLPPISPNLAASQSQMNSGTKRDLSKPKSFHQNQASLNATNDAQAMMRRSGGVARGNTPQRRQIQQLMGGNNRQNDDQISEIDINSDTRSMYSHTKLPLKQNNLMGTGNDFHNKMNSSLNEQKWGGAASQFSDSRGMLDAQSQSNYGSANGSNMFHPRARGDPSSMET